MRLLSDINLTPEWLQVLGTPPVKGPTRESTIARSCDEELLSRQPTASGKIVLDFDIVGDGDAGVVDRVDLRGNTTFEDSDFDAPQAKERGRSTRVEALE